MRERNNLPLFVAEALAEQDNAEQDNAGQDSAQQTAQTYDALRFHELLAPSTAPSGAQRLLQQIETWEFRYAPFFERMAALWDLDTEQVQAVMRRAQSERAWSGTGLPGLRVLHVAGGARVADAELHLVRFRQGMRFPEHRHPGPEALLVLEGEYTDSQGRRVQAGEIQTMEPGSVHALRVGKDSACVAASVQAGREFTSGAVRGYDQLVRWWHKLSR